MRIIVITTLFTALLGNVSAAIAETNWEAVPSGTDDLTGQKTAAIVFLEDDHRTERLRSKLALTHDENAKLMLILFLNNLDRLPPGQGDVSVSYRADGAEMQKATPWKRDDLRTAMKYVTAEEAKAMFQGKFLIVSFDVSGKRYRYPIDDDDADEFRKAIDDLIVSEGK